MQMHTYLLRVLAPKHLDGGDTKSFEDKETAVVVSVSHLSYHFSSRVLGLPAGIYVIVSIVQEGFEWSLDLF